MKLGKRNIFKRNSVYAFGLHPVFCKVFVLCDIAGCTIAETAAILGVGPAAVALRLARAHREINIRLGMPNRPAVTFTN